MSTIRFTSAFQPVSSHTQPKTNVRFGAYKNPTPDRELIDALVPVTDNLLSGTPVPKESMALLREQFKGLKMPPLLSALVGSVIGMKVRGKDMPFHLSNRFLIEGFDFPQAEQNKLSGIINPNTAVFLAPNHPEFMTDWLIDKKLSAAFAPTMASFAAASIVEAGQSFWLKNNLIGNNGGKEAQEYAIQNALQGNVSLLHPEGTVHWNGNVVRNLMPGVADMAIEAAKRSVDQGLDKPVYIASPIWKMTFTEDAANGLHADMADLEAQLHLPSGNKKQTPAERFHQLQENYLDQQAKTLGVDLSSKAGEPFFTRANALMKQLLSDVSSGDYEIKAGGSIEQQLHRLNKAVGEKMKARAQEFKAEEQAKMAPVPEGDKKAHQKAKKAIAKAVKARLREDGDAKQYRLDQKKLKEMLRLRDFSSLVYGQTETITQEEIAEGLKALRSHLRKGNQTAYQSIPVAGKAAKKALDEFRVTLPKPVGPRKANIRVTDPIEVTELVKQARAEGKSDAELSQEIMFEVSRRMQGTLNALNAEIEETSPRIREANPFYQPEDATP
jgi:hypothetical protein